MENNSDDVGLNPMEVLQGESSGYIDCSEVASKLYNFLDGELTDEKREAIKRHLDHCAPCVEVFEFEADLKKLVANRCQEKVPETLRQRIASVISIEASVSSIEKDTQYLSMDAYPDFDIN